MLYAGLHFLVLGLGESGLACARWLHRQGAQVRVADSREQPPGAADLARQVPGSQLFCGPFGEVLLEGIDRLVISPGLAVETPLVVTAQARGIPVWGEIELFAQALDGLGLRARCKLLAITGTNGKTTTTTLAGALCRAAGQDAAIAGNISPSALTELMDRLDADELPDVWVLELSSFQLETTLSLQPDAATVLNVTDDHLDRHGSMARYAEAKARIFAGAGSQVLNREDALVMAMARPGRKVCSFGLDAQGDYAVQHEQGRVWLCAQGARLLAQDEMRLAGLHNVANALAALALCESIGLPRAPMVQALREFKGLSHRVELVATRADGVGFYDDSKGTNVGATVAALQGMGRKVVLIAGGDGKGQDFAPLAQPVSEHARAVVLIGRDGPRIGSALQGCGVPLLQAGDMADAVRQAAASAQAGDAVLLSPACASFDMFRNYAHRAQVFIDAVLAQAEVQPA